MRRIHAITNLAPVMDDETIRDRSEDDSIREPMPRNLSAPNAKDGVAGPVQFPPPVPAGPRRRVYTKKKSAKSGKPNRRRDLIEAPEGQRGPASPLLCHLETGVGRSPLAVALALQRGILARIASRTSSLSVRFRAPASRRSSKDSSLGSLTRSKGLGPLPTTPERLGLGMGLQYGLVAK
jgi:hypothetical protein